MKIYIVAAVLIHADRRTDGRTDMTKVKGVLPTTRAQLKSQICHCPLREIESAEKWGSSAPSCHRL